MNYVIGDIHGCYEAYAALMDKLALTEEDEVYVLGDAVDRGPEPIRVLQDLMARESVTYLLGNHDVMMLQTLRPLMEKVTAQAVEQLPEDLVPAYQSWMYNGGGVTLEQFLALPREEQWDILDYLEQAPAYAAVEVGEKLFVLVHAGLDHFAPDKELEDYQFHDLVWVRPDYSRCYFPGERIVLVTGHTPTPLIRPDRRPLIYTGQGHAAIDCGCVFGGQLAAYCMETERACYTTQPRPVTPGDIAERQKNPIK